MVYYYYLRKVYINTLAMGPSIYWSTVSAMEFDWLNTRMMKAVILMVIQLFFKGISNFLPF